MLVPAQLADARGVGFWGRLVEAPLQAVWRKERGAGGGRAGTGVLTYGAREQRMPRLLCVSLDVQPIWKVYFNHGCKWLVAGVSHVPSFQLG